MRAASNVTIGIQPEDGQRILREFPPDTTLARALTEMYPDSDLERAVLIYMHREVCIQGEQKIRSAKYLENKTLRKKCFIQKL